MTDDETQKEITRRDFLRGAVGVTFVGVAGLPILANPDGPTEGAARNVKKTRVVLVRDASVLDAYSRPDAQVLQRMLDDAVTALLDEPDPVAAWKRLVQPSDTVGIKSNVWRFLPTPSELEAAIKRRLIDAGVDEKKIGIDDRGVLENPIFRKATALINVRPLRTHHWAGIGGCIKNHIMFVPNPPDYHPDSCANLASLWDLPAIKGKTRLNILVMLTPLFHGKGPHHFQKRYIWEYKGLLVSIDPVAVDATGVRILRAKRMAFFGKHKPIDIPPKHIRIAEEKFHLGIADASRIELMKLGWMEDALI